MKKKILFLILVTLALSTTNVYAEEAYSITISLDNVQDVSPAHLEGWIIIGDEKHSFGKFAVEDMIMDMMGGGTKAFMVDMDISMADTIAITIEPEGDMDKVPSGIVLVSGELSNNAAKLSFPVNLEMISGTYILATPSNGADSDENSGIWFLELPGPDQGLTLPILPSGWVYEGWVVHEGTPLTSGRFLDVADFDLFDGYSASTTYPPFPGEDYLVNPPMGVMFPIDLADGMSKAVISIEPDLMGVDPTGEAPFSIKPLIGDIPLNADDHVNYDLVASMAPLPSGLAVVSMDTMGSMSTIEMLEEQVSSLKSEKSMLEDEITMLKSEISGLEDKVTMLETSIMDLEYMGMTTVPLGSWQAIAALALVIGLVIGAAIIYFRK